MSPRITLLAVALSICLPLQAATEVIQLNNRMGEEVLPVAESVLGGQGRVTAYGNQLIVNAPDALIRELRQVVDQLDVAPKRLLISVDTQDSANSTAGGYRVDGSARAGDVEFETGRGEIGGRDQVRIIRRSTNSRDGGIQQIQASEGYPALIQVGQSVPLTTQGSDGYGQIYQQTQYRDVLRGFYATATVHGDRVQISISSSRDRLAQAAVASSKCRMPIPASAGASANGSPWAASMKAQVLTSAARCVAIPPRAARTFRCA